MDGIGNIYTTGYVGDGSATFGPGEQNQTSVTGRKLFVAKYGGSGNLVWVMPSAGDADAYGLSADSGGSAYIVGNGTTTLGSNATAVSGTFLAKYDTLGNLLWARSISGNGSAVEGRAIARDSSGNTFVTGSFTTTVTFADGEANETTLTSLAGFMGGDIFVAKYDTNGAFLWARQAGGDTLTNGPVEQGLGISVDANSRAYVTGIFSGSSTFGSGEPNATTLTSAGGSDIFLAKYMDNGPVEIRYSGGDGCQDFVTGPVGQGFATNCVGTTLSGTTVVQASATLALVKLHLQSTGQTPVPSKSAETRVRDTLTVTGGTGTGTLVWNWAMDGTLDASDGIYSQVYFSNLGGGAFADFRACGSNVQFGSSICVFDAAPNPPGGLRAAQSHETVNETRSISIPFTFGVPLNVDWRLNAVIANGCTYGNNCNASAYAIGGNVDFFSTAQLQPVVVLDGGGNQVTGASAVSNSGFSYPVAGAPAPPVLGAIGPKTVTEGAMLVFDATATPANGLTFSLDSGAPARATITSGGHFSWIPTEAQGPGSYPVTIRVTDDSSPAQSDSEQITITVNEVNSPPVLNIAT